jgi:hypothetical protein
MFPFSDGKVMKTNFYSIRPLGISVVIPLPNRIGISYNLKTKTQPISRILWFLCEETE